MNYTYSHGDIELDCELDYSPAESDPPWPAQAILLRAMVGGVDVVPLLSDNLIEQIEEGAAWSMQS